MDERTQKVAATCFASGCATFLALCIAVPTIGIGWALLVGAAIGAPIGYFGYRFKDVLRAIPLAARATYRTLSRGLRDGPELVWDIACNVSVAIWNFLYAKRPTFYASLVLTAIMMMVFIEYRMASGPSNWFVWAYGGAVFVAVLILIAPQAQETGIFFAFASGGLALLAACMLKHAQPSLGVIATDAISALLLLPFFWVLHFAIAITTLDGTHHGRQWAKRFASGDVQDNVDRLINPFGVYPFRIFFAMYGSAIVWSIRGVAWLVFKLVTIIFWHLPRLVGIFVAKLFRLIHSNERTICAIDGPLGGIVTYAALRIHHGSEIATLPPMTLLGLVLLGGAVAAFIGILNLELVSIRWLKLLPARASK